MQYEQDEFYSPAFSYRLHKASGQAVVTIDRKDHYLGLHGTGESRLRYERLITAWMQGETASPREPDESNDITVAEVCARYLRHAENWYVKDGEPTTELQNVGRAIRALRECSASLPAKDFSPLKLEAVRDDLGDRWTFPCELQPLHRHCGPDLFRYAVDKSWSRLVWPMVEAVKSLAKGRGCKAHETEPSAPSMMPRSRQRCHFCERTNRGNLGFQFAHRDSPAELVLMRTGEIDRSGETNSPILPTHKTEHHSKSWIIPIWPRAQSCWSPGSRPIPPRFIFGSQRGGRVSVTAYRFRIHLGCDKAGIAVVPQSTAALRNNPDSPAGQSDAAQVILGRSNISMTETYAERNLDAASVSRPKRLKSMSKASDHRQPASRLNDLPLGQAFFGHCRGKPGVMTRRMARGCAATL